jgi:hypothetical protein
MEKGAVFCGIKSGWMIRIPYEQTRSSWTLVLYFDTQECSGLSTPSRGFPRRGNNRLICAVRGVRRMADFLRIVCMFSAACFRQVTRPIVQSLSK